MLSNIKFILEVETDIDLKLCQREVGSAMYLSSIKD